MNVRERFHRVMSFNAGVPAPKWEFGYWGENYENWYEEGLPRINYPAVPDPSGTHVDLYGPCWRSATGGRLPAGIGVLAGGLYYPTQSFVLDQDARTALNMDVGQISVNVNLLFSPQFDVVVHDEDETKLVYIDIDGVKRLYIKETGVIPTAIENVIKDWSGWNKLKDERLRMDTIKDRLPSGWDDQLARHRNRDYVLVLGGYPAGYFGTLAHLMGYEHLFYNYSDAPDLIHDIQRTFTDIWIATYEEVLAQTDVDLFIFWEDISAGSGSMVSPAMIREYMLPYYKRITDFLKEHGVNTIFVDTDGDCAEIIPLFIEGGVTGIYPVEVSCGMDLLQTRKNHPDLQIMGGIPKSELPKGRERIDEILRDPAELLKSGGYVPFGDHLIPPEVHWEEFKYYRERLNDAIHEATL